MKKETELEFLKDLQLKIQAESKKEGKRLLESHNIRDELALQKSIRELDKAIRRSRKQDVGDDEEVEKPSFDLLEIPDDQLDEDQVKKKRHQRMMKSNWDARQRAKVEKELEKQRLLEEERRDEEAREKDLEGWVRERRDQREVCLIHFRLHLIRNEEARQKFGLVCSLSLMQSEIYQLDYTLNLIFFRVS